LTGNGISEARPALILCLVLTGVLSSSGRNVIGGMPLSAGLLLHARIKSDDLVTVGVDADMKLAPGPAFRSSVFFKQPFARSRSFNPLLSTIRCSSPAPERGRL
jgi:hypothetical protein